MLYGNSEKSKLSSFGATVLLLGMSLNSQAVTLFCTPKEGVYPAGVVTAFEFRFDEAGTFEYGPSRQKMQGRVTENSVLFISADKATGWYIDRMNGKLYFVRLSAVDQSPDFKDYFGSCRDATERKF